MPPGRKIQARITATAKDAYRRRLGHSASPEMTTSASPKATMVGRVP